MRAFRATRAVSWYQERMPDPEDSRKASSAVLLANASFYRAFSDGDFETMDGLWAREAVVSCSHPGMPVLHGRAAVLESWRRILRSGTGRLRGIEPRVCLLGAAALVTCYESARAHPAHLAATNVFVLEQGEWRMVHHQAGPLAQPLPAPERSELN